MSRVEFAKAASEAAAAPSMRSPRRRGLVVVWLTAIVVYGGLTIFSRATRGPIADPDPAYQRPGFIDVIQPYSAGSLGANIPAPHTRSVVFFTRPQLESELLSSVAADRSLQFAARVVVVVCGAGPVSATSPGGIAIVGQDASCPSAALYKMRTPRDGGAPVGYAIVSSAGLVRYSTLDPEVVHLLAEVEVMARGVQ